MFTGIIEETGQIETVERKKDGTRLCVSASFVPESGASVAVNGACLTAEQRGNEKEGNRKKGRFELFLSEETVEKTWLGALSEGNEVNLERAMPADARFDGHIVQGHVDTTTEVTGVRQIGEDWEYGFKLPEGYERYLVPKGSVTIDGISLTIAEIDEGKSSFTVAVIPETRRVTNLSEKKQGDPVNLEVDVVAKYIESMVSTNGTSSPYQ